jgi:ribosomal protein S6
VKRYEGLFILDTAGKEDTVKDILDRVASEITSAGGRIETVQKKYSSGYYANVIFESEPAVLDQLRHRFAVSNEVFRVAFTNLPPLKPAVKTT